MRIFPKKYMYNYGAILIDTLVIMTAAVLTIYFADPRYLLILLIILITGKYIHNPED